MPSTLKRVAVTLPPTLEQAIVTEFGVCNAQTIRQALLARYNIPDTLQHGDGARFPHKK